MSVQAEQKRPIKPSGHGRFSKKQRYVEDQKPYLKADVMFARSELGVEFHRDHTRFLIEGNGAYDAFRGALPMLEGTVTFAEIRQHISASAFETFSLLENALYEHAFIQRLEPETAFISDVYNLDYQEQIRFLANYTPHPRETLAQIRAYQISVCGPEIVSSSLSAALEENGTGTVARIPWQEFGTQKTGARVVIRHPDSPEIAWQVPIWSFGDKMLVGPLLKSNSDPRFAGVQFSALENGSANDCLSTIQPFFREVGHPWPATATPAIERMTGVLAAFEIFKLLSDVVPAQISTGVVSLSSTTGTTEFHEYRYSKVATEPVSKENAGVSENASANAVSEEAAAFESLVDEFIGDVKALDDDNLLQVPLRLSIAVTRIAGEPERRVRGESAVSITEARISAIIQALALRSCSTPPADYPKHCMSARAAQRFGFPLGIGAHSTVLAVPGTVIETGAELLVPAAAIYTRTHLNRMGQYLPYSGGFGISTEREMALRTGWQRAATTTALNEVLAGERFGVPYSIDGEQRENPLFQCLNLYRPRLNAYRLGKCMNFCVAIVGDTSGESGIWEAAAGGSDQEAISAAVTRLAARLQLRHDTGEQPAIDLPLGQLRLAELVGNGGIATEQRKPGRSRNPIAVEVSNPRWRGRGLYSFVVVPQVEELL